MQILFVTLVSFFAILDAAEKPPAPTILNLKVTESGFGPKTLKVAPGTEVILKIVRETDATCSKVLQIPSHKIKVDLPLKKTVNVQLGRLDKGEIKFGCSMDMMDSGVILVQ